MFDIKRVLKGLVLFVIFFSVIFPLSLTAVEADEDDPQEKTEKQKKIDRLFKMSLEELMDVRITTAGKTSQRIGDIPASVVLITREDIEMYGYTSLAEILQNIPGLYGIDDYAEGDMNFGVRGFWSGVANNNMVILVNGVHQVSDFQSNYPLYKIPIPVEAIERIEVVRGPMSVIYGSGAFYGAIDIITNDEKIRSPVSMVSASIGSDKTHKVFLRVAGQSDEFKYAFNASLFDTYGLDKPFIEMVAGPGILPSFGLSEEQTTGGTLEENQKYLNFSGNYKSFHFNLNYVENNRDLYFFFPSFSDGTNAAIITTDLSFGYKREYSKKLAVDSKFTYSRNRVIQRYDYFFDHFYGIEMLESNAWEAEVNLFWTPNPKWDITTGFYYRSILDAIDMYDLPSYADPSIENSSIKLADGNNIVTRALFSQIEFEPLKNLRFVAGVRLEQSSKYKITAELGSETPAFTVIEGTYDKHNIEIIPRFAAIFSLNDHNIFKLLYGKAINRPSFFQNAINILNPLGDDLDPESIETFELNFITTISSSLNINASVFHNTLYNLITRVVRFDDTGNYVSFSDNAGKLVTNGVELTINTEPIEYFRIELSGTYQDTKDKTPDFENIAVAYSPKFLGYVKASFLGDGYKVSMTGNYVGPMETFWDQTLPNPSGQLGGRVGDKVDGYFVVGASLRIEDIFRDGLFLNVKCSNLFDEDVRYPTFTNNPWASRGTIGFGRSFIISVGYKF